VRGVWSAVARDLADESCMRLRIGGGCRGMRGLSGEAASSCPSRKGRPVVSVTVRPTLDDSGIARCGECGAWMMQACGTDHGRRYEP